MKHINPSTLFEGDIEDNKAKIAESLFDTVQDYLKLERIEMFGLKAKSLLSMVNNIYEEFIKLYQQFGDVAYEVLMPEEEQFTADLNEFFASIEQFDRRLASIFDQAFAECYNLESFFKFVWIMGVIANRPIIMAQLWHNYEEIIQRVDRHFSDIKVLFDKNFNSGKNTELSTLNSYLPVVSASLFFLMRLRKRTLLPIECMKLIDHPLINDKMEHVLKDKYEELEAIIDEKEKEIFTAWAEKLPEIWETHLTKTLLNVKEDQLLETNFDFALRTALREIRYMIIAKIPDLSQEAIDFYNRSQFFFISTYNLNLIVN